MSSYTPPIPPIDVLLEQCRSGDPDQQVAAIHSLIDQEASEAAPVIAGLLQSPDSAVRHAAVHALGWLGDQQLNTIGPVLLQALTDQAAIVRSEVVDTLGILQYQPAFEAIRVLLREDPEPLVRASAAETLGDLGNTQAIPDLEAAMHDPDDAVRAYAANALGLLGTEALIPILQRINGSEASLQVQAELAGAMYRLGSTEALHRLLGLVDTADEDSATAIMNILVDLAQRKRPQTLTADIPLIKTHAEALSLRFPILAPHIDELVSELEA